MATSQLQHSLLKIALLLGVRVHFGIELSEMNSLGALLPTLTDTPATSRTESAVPETFLLHEHPLMRCHALMGHYCDVGAHNCGSDSDVPTAYRCMMGCEFDVCQACYDDACVVSNQRVPAASDADTTARPLATVKAPKKTVENTKGAARSKHSRSNPSMLKPQSPASEARILPDVLIDATGARGELFSGVGFTQSVALKTARALCIVIHLVSIAEDSNQNAPSSLCVCEPNASRACALQVNGRMPDELRLPESTWSQQYHQHLFAALQADGVVLQNFVYYRSTGAFATTPVHYFVMTTEVDALLAARVLRTTSPMDGALLTASANVDMELLEAYARRAIGVFVPLLVAQPMVPGALSLFDFSERKQSNRASLFAPVVHFGGLPGDASVVLVTRVGDALQVSAPLPNIGATQPPSA